MTMVDMDILSDGLHRLAKAALDSGEAATVEEALAQLHSYAIHIVAGPSVTRSAAQQAALLTLANAGRRAFLGGVTVSGLVDGPLLVPLPDMSGLAEAVTKLGARIGGPAMPLAPRIIIGDGEADDSGLCLRLNMRGWSFACAPGGHDDAGDDPDAFVLTGVAAASVALSEMFQALRGTNAAAGRRQCGFSLWNPEVGWGEDDGAPATLARLPRSAWLVGLGNLGQAYLWCLGMLPYAAPGEVRLTLQDFDRIAPSNDSTSLLTCLDLVRRHKSRAMADWAERRGFAATIVERRFDAKLRVGRDDPAVALCGVDNRLARAALEDAGFARIFEAGLGNGPSDFLALRLHSFPGARTARALWPELSLPTDDLLDRRAYRALAEQGAERCGLVRLAGRSVGAPFVGALAGALVICELVRLANGGPNMALLDLHLRDAGQRIVVPQDGGFGYNPGTVASTAI